MILLLLLLLLVIHPPHREVGVGREVPFSPSHYLAHFHSYYEFIQSIYFPIPESLLTANELARSCATFVFISKRKLKVSCKYSTPIMAIIITIISYYWNGRRCCFHFAYISFSISNMKVTPTPFMTFI